MSDKTLTGKSSTQEGNRLLRLVHPTLRAIRFCLPEDMLGDLLHQASMKLDQEARQLALDLIDTTDLQYGYAADLRVDEVHRKKGVLQPLPYAEGVVDGNWWDALGMCAITVEWCLHVAITVQWCLHVPDCTYPALFASVEKHFLHRCTTPSPYISLLPPVSSPELPTPPLKLYDSRREPGWRVCKGALSPREASPLNTTATASLERVPTQRDAVWDVVSNTHPREFCWANPKRACRWGTRPGKLAMLLGRETCKRVAKLSGGNWPTMRN